MRQRQLLKLCCVGRLQDQGSLIDDVVIEWMNDRMFERDVVVGVVAIGVGLVLIANIWIYRKSEAKIGTMQMLEQRFGVEGAKVFVALLGLGLVVLGLVLILWMPSADRQPNVPEGSGDQQPLSAAIL